MPDSTPASEAQPMPRAPRPVRADAYSFTWWLALAYIVYAAVGDVPQLATLPEFSIVASSSLFVLLYLIHSYVHLGWRDASRYLAVSALLGYGFEYLFITTGWVGHYVYTANLSPFLGPIPVFIPLLWASLGYFCLIAGGGVVAPALLMVFLDMAFDPRFAQTLWRWVPPGPYFGVPIANFVGWFVTALAIFAVFALVSGKRVRPSPRGVIFYLAFGMVNGSLPDFSSGLSEAAGIAVLLFVAASAVLFLRARASPGDRLPDSGSPPPGGAKRFNSPFTEHHTALDGNDDPDAQVGVPPDEASDERRGDQTGRGDQGQFRPPGGRQIGVEERRQGQAPLRHRD